MDITLKQMRAFLAVAQAGSFTLAANRLHLTQSAVSVLIGEFERTVGLRVFDRTTRLVQLTDAGRELHPVAHKVLADLSQMLASSRDLADRKRGRVTVAATPLMSSTLIAGAIARHAQQHPGVQLILRDTQAAQVQIEVRDGLADFGVGTFERGGRELDAEPFMVDTLVLACPASHVLAGRSMRPRWRDLAGQPFIALRRDNSVGQLIADCLAAEGVQVQIVHEVSYLSTLLALVDAGLGVAVLPSYARPLMPTRGMVVRPLLAPVVRREISVFTRHGRSLSPAALGFKDFLLATVTEQRPGLALARRGRHG